VAKRVRGSHSTHRPGGQAPTRPQRPPTASAVTSASGDVATADGIGLAIDSVVLETTEVTIADPVAPALTSSRARKRFTVKQDSLQARVAAENIYVREDLRRIAVVSGILISGLAVAWVLFVLLDLFGLY
jgi:hypothetical protein